MAELGPETVAEELDITDQVCPMTFVRTKLRIEKMAAGSLLRVILREGEALENVPRSLTLEGHEVLSLEPVGSETGIHALLVRKAG